MKGRKIAWYRYHRYPWHGTTCGTVGLRCWVRKHLCGDQGCYETRSNNFDLAEWFAGNDGPMCRHNLEYEGPSIASRLHRERER